MGKRDGPITNGDEKRIGATQQNYETGGRLKKTEQKNAGAATTGSSRQEERNQKDAESAGSRSVTENRKKPGSRDEATKSEDAVTAKRRRGGAEQRNNRLKNRVDVTGQKQPGGRNRQDAWAIRKNRKNR